MTAVAEPKTAKTPKTIVVPAPTQEQLDAPLREAYAAAMRCRTPSTDEALDAARRAGRDFARSPRWAAEALNLADWTQRHSDGLAPLFAHLHEVVRNDPPKALMLLCKPSRIDNAPAGFWRDRGITVAVIGQLPQAVAFAEAVAAEVTAILAQLGDGEK